MAGPGDNPDRRAPEDEARRVQAPVEGAAGAPTETAPAQVDRDKLGEQVAEGNAKAPESKDAYDKVGAELPDNQWKRAYIEMYKQLKANPELDGPLSRFMLSLLAMAAKYMKYGDYIPGQYLSRLNNDSYLKSQEFDEEEERKMLEAKKRDQAVEEARKAEVAKRLSDAAAEAARKGELIGFEAASTEYVAWSLWGISSINSATVLGAKLLHTQEDNVPFYEGKAKVDGDLEYGTVVVLADTSDMKKGEKIVAMATGMGRQVQFFSPRTAQVETVDLAQKENKSFAGLRPLAYFVPLSEEKRAELKAQEEAGESEEKPKEAEVISYGTGNAALDQARENARRINESFSAGANLFAARLEMALKTGQIKDQNQLLQFQQEALTWESKFLEVQSSLSNWKKFVDEELKSKAASLSPEQKEELDTSLKIISLLMESSQSLIEIIRKRKEDLQKEKAKDIK
ncbi:hypothetical protein HY605_03100 [Candidatus Peregrinibacteria bacterium]|nr:hypothetical protein [Candidatus Peregrinibacteria bacterium]